MNETFRICATDPFVECFIFVLNDCGSVLVVLNDARS